MKQDDKKNRVRGSKQKFPDQMIKDALDSAGGRFSEAATKLGISSMTLYRRLKTKELKDYYCDTKKMNLDLTLSKLGDAVEDGREWAIKESLRHYSKYDEDNDIKQGATLRILLPD